MKAFQGPDAPEPPLHRGCVKVKVTFRFPRGARPREHHSCVREAPPSVTRTCPPPADACPPPMSAHWRKNGERFSQNGERFSQNGERFSQNGERFPPSGERFLASEHQLCPVLLQSLKNNDDFILCFRLFVLPLQRISRITHYLYYTLTLI
ncbi:MAG: hypothetical protein IJ155_00990 [Prevotella sp.]|nr:hypothetical protein [Prevotella sp.]